jgi:hypothetical protein
MNPGSAVVASGRGLSVIASLPGLMMSWLMTARWTAARFMSAALLAVSTTSTFAQNDSEQLLMQVLSAVSAKPLDATPFFERRMSSLYSRPLESKGTLSYKPPGTLEKLTTSPIRERVTVAADLITIQSGDSAAVKVIKLEGQPNLQAFTKGLRAVMAGEIKPIRQYFDPLMTGSFAQWNLKLVPIDSALKRALKQIIVTGQGAQVRVIETTELGGDVNELTLLADR